jgi:hypothetical protein
MRYIKIILSLPAILIGGIGLVALFSVLVPKTLIGKVVK